MSTISCNLWLVPAAALALMPALSGCEDIECGDGTIEVDGVCEVGDEFDPTNPVCARGTHLDGGECVPDFPPTRCEEGAASTIGEDGVIVCEGGSITCATIACSTPDANKVSLCGQIRDVQTGEKIGDQNADVEVCDKQNPTADGPCSLQVEFYDAFQFANNPETTTPLPADLIEINTCGHFKGINVKWASLGMSVAIDDQTNGGAVTPPNPHVRATGIALNPLEGETLRDVRAFVIAESTDEAWTTSAGDPFGVGVTFVDMGVYVPVFRNPGPVDGVPVEGVQVTGSGVRPDDDYYFDDADPDTRLSVAASQNETGANGVALLVGSGLTEHSGTGGEPSGCEWQTDLAKSIPGVLFFRESFLHVTGEPGTPCVP